MSDEHKIGDRLMNTRALAVWETYDRLLTLLGDGRTCSASSIGSASLDRARTALPKGVRLDVDSGIVRPDSVDERGEAVGQRGIRDLEHVLGVLLAGVREVEAADEDDVVGDGDFRVHVVVHSAWGVRGGVLAGEGRM